MIPNRNLKADLIRSIAISFVVTLHIVSYYLNLIGHTNSFNWWFLTIMESVTKVAVPLFIILSGYLILDSKKTYDSIGAFYRKRISRIGIPIIFWTIFYYLAFTILTNQLISITDFIYKFIFLDIFYHLYFYLLFLDYILLHLF